MLILVAGMPRTGSTWLYNVVRFAYLGTGRTVYGGGVDDYDPSIKADVHVVKLHDFHADLLMASSIVLSSIRDLRDIAASMVRKGWVRNNPKELRAYLQTAIDTQYRPWVPHSALEVQYSQIVHAPESVVATVLLTLGVFSDPCEIVSDVAKISRVVTPHMNPSSMFWPGHITDGGVGTYGKTLSKSSIRSVEALARKVRWGA